MWQNEANKQQLRIEVAFDMEQNRIEFPGRWNVDAIMRYVRSVLETPHMTEIDLNIHADMDSIPTMTYTITRLATLDSK